MLTKFKRYSLLGYPGPKGADGSGVAVSAGTTLVTEGTVSFQNSNSITFGLASNGVLTASFSQSTHSHDTLAGGGGEWATATKTGSDIQISTGATNTLHYGKFITTYVSGGEGGGAGLNSAITGGSMTVNTSGISINLPGYLTTAAQSIHTHDYQSTGDYLTSQSTHSHPYIASGDSTAYQTSVLSNTFQTTGAYITSESTHSHIVYQTTGNYLITAAQSDHTHGAGTTASTAGTDLVITSASNSWQFGVPKWITTAAPTNHTHSDVYEPLNKTHSDLYMGTGERASFYNTTNNTLANSTHSHGSVNISATSNATETAMRFTSNSSGWTIVQPSFLTTAAGSGHTHSDLYSPVGNSSAYQSATLASTFAQTANVMLTGERNNYLYTSLSSNASTAAAGISHTHGSNISTASTAGSEIAMSSASNGLTLGMPKWLTAASAAGVQWEIEGNNSAGTTGSVDNIIYFSGGNNITLSGNSNTIIVSAGAGGGGIAASISAGGNSTSSGSGYSNITSGTMFLQGGDNITLSQNGAKISIIGASANGPASVIFQDGNGVSFASTVAGSSTTIGASVNAGGGNTLSYYEPSEWNIHSYSSTRGINTLGVQPFYPPYAISFGHINMIGSGSVAPTSHGNTVAFRAAGNSSHGFSQSHTIENKMFEDVFLFSKGTGYFSTNLFSFASTRVTFGTRILESWAHSGVGPSAGSVASASNRRTMSLEVSFPAITSGTSTSINANSSATIWATGYSSFGSTASNSISTTYNTTNTTGNYNLASTFPAATAFSSYKMVPLNFASSLTPGEYWIGMKRSTSTASTVATANANQGANNSYTTTYQASNLTRTDQINWAGNTNTIVSSLGPFGAASNAYMGPWYGIGTLSVTYDPAATYVNNMGQAAGAFAFTQLRTNVSFFRSWLQFVGNDAEGV
jgi:hypothetical protein